MSGGVGNEIMTGFIGEVEGYLPDMRRCLQILQQDRSEKTSLAELHRISHTIKGAAAMVGLDDLSGMGEILEKVMENVLGSALVLDDETLRLIGEATGLIERYCVIQRAGDANDRQLFLKTIAELEKKLSQSTAPADEEGEDAYSPEALFFEQETDESEEILTEEDAFLSASEESEEDLFLDADAAVSEHEKPEFFFDEMSLSLTEDEEDDQGNLDSELFLEDVEVEDDEDDYCFGVFKCLDTIVLFWPYINQI
ncbi:MAG: hypothetical protein D3906_01315, partial [Candidatus Electrothrix sp. AUS1_2]|nr:hypothetical protein [Candidatus Electrothrix sp. AUS1_2]